MAKMRKPLVSEEFIRPIVAFAEKQERERIIEYLKARAREDEHKGFTDGFTTQYVYKLVTEIMAGCHNDS